MFSMLKNLTKAVVAVAVTPVDAVVDVLTLPASSLDPHRGPFDHTAKRLQQAGDALDAAIKPEKD
jgi:hypothetical protein